MLYNGYLVFYNSLNQAEYFLYDFKPQTDQSSFVDTKISASSELNENGTVYRAANLFDVGINGKLLPWAEGVPGDGKGERIKIEFETSLVFGLGGFYISNGYVDYNRPYLYESNNRLKKIRVRYEGYDEYRDFELEDTPQLQYITVEMNFKPHTVFIEILEVYKGTRWDDTCVNLIIPIGF